MLGWFKKKFKKDKTEHTEEQTLASPAAEEVADDACCSRERRSC